MLLMAGMIIIALHPGQFTAYDPLNGGPGGTVLYWSIMAVLFVLALFLPRWNDEAWHSCSRLLEDRLRSTEAGQFLLQPESLSAALDVLPAWPWLRLLVQPQRKKLEQQVEFMASHWRTLLAIPGDRRKLSQAVWHSSLLLLTNWPMAVCIRYDAVWAFLLVISFMYMSFIYMNIWWSYIPIIGLALLCFIPLIRWHTQINAAQVAIIDFLLE